MTVCHPASRGQVVSRRLHRAVVVAVDGSKGGPAAVGWAACEAVSLGVPLRLVNVIGWPYAGAGADDARTLSAEVLAEAAACARSSVDAALDVITETVSGPLVPILADISGRAHTLVLGHRGGSGFAGMVLGSRSVAVATHASGPVAVVPERSPSQWRPAGDTVVVGVDGGSARAALGYAFAYASRHGLEVEALFAEPPGSVEEQDVPTDVPREVAAAFPGVSWHERRVTGPPVEALTAAAATDTALLVVGCRSRMDPSSPLLGSVSRGAIFLARCPVVVV